MYITARSQHFLTENLNIFANTKLFSKFFLDYHARKLGRFDFLLNKKKPKTALEGRFVFIFKTIVPNLKSTETLYKVASGPHILPLH